METESIKFEAKNQTKPNFLRSVWSGFHGLISIQLNNLL